MIRRKVPSLGGKSLTNSLESNEFDQALEREETYRIISLTMNLGFTFFSSDGEQLDFQEVLNSQYEKKKIIHRNISQKGFLEVEQKEIQHIITTLDEYGWDTNDIRYIVAIDYLHWIEEHDSDKLSDRIKNRSVNSVPPVQRVISCFIDLPESMLIELKERLINRSFIDIHTTQEQINYTFGKIEKTEDIYPIKWIKNKQLLRELVSALKHPDTRICSIEEIIPELFVNDKNQPIRLSKNKAILSMDSEELENICKTIKRKKATL